MQNLLEFVEHYTLDPHLYYRIDGYEIMWQRQGSQTWWKFSRENSNLWTHAAHADVVGALRAAGIDVAAFEQRVTESILAQAVYADIVMSKAEEVLGPQAVQAAIIDSVAFSKQLAELVNNLTRPKLRLV
jgi:hypothetical protein